jgi:hypothetical protein
MMLTCMLVCLMYMLDLIDSLSVCPAVPQPSALDKRVVADQKI